MRAANRCVSLLTCSFVAAIAGCGGGGAGSSLPSSPGASSNTGVPLPGSGGASLQSGANDIYVANQTANSIDVFSLAANCRAKVASITSGVDGPYGLWFDEKSQSLLVANQNNNTVTAYVNGSASAATTYSQGLSRPLYPILDHNGNLYVGNANGGTIVEYASGTTTVMRTLQTPGAETDGLAFDQQGDLFAAYRTSNDPGAGSIVEFAAGSSSGTQLGMTLTAPQGLVVDSQGNITVAETQGVNRLDLFAPGASTASLQVAIPNNDTPTGVALDSAQGHMYVSTLGGKTYGISYPLGGATFFVQDSESALDQGVTITNNLNV